MINIRFIISTLLLIAITLATPTYAGEYRVLVLPNSVINSAKKNKIGSVDIEEMLAKKIIKRLEDKDMACAPTMDILRIGIINNPYYVKNPSNPMNNAKIISKSYNVSKVLLVSSNVVIKNPSQQREFWKSLNIPAISSSEAHFKLVTTVSMYDIKTDQILWSDVYYNNLNKASDGMKSIKIATVNSYYDKITDKLLEDLRTTTSTSAILIGENRIPEWGKGGKYATPTLSSAKNNMSVEAKIVTEPQEDKVNTNKVTKVKLVKKTQNQFFKKMKFCFDSQCLKFRNYQENRKIEKANKLVKDSHKMVQDNKKQFALKHEKKQITKQTAKPILVKKVKPEEKSKIKITKKPQSVTDKKSIFKLTKNTKKTEPKVAQKPLKQEKKTVKNNIKKETFSMAKIKQNWDKFLAKRNAPKTAKVAKEKSQIKFKPKAKKQVATEQTKKKNFFQTTKNKIVQTKEKIVQNKKPKENKPTVSEKIKNKYTGLKQVYIEKKNKQIKQEEQTHQYTTVIAPIMSKDSNINGYIQTKPRNSSWNYLPQFNDSVNDI